MICFSQLISLLPPGNQLILKSILYLSRDIEKESEINKMTATNLAIIFAPSFMKSKTESPLDLMNNIPTYQRIVEFLINNSEALFSPNTQKKQLDVQWQQTLRRYKIAFIFLIQFTKFD